MAHNSYQAKLKKGKHAGRVRFFRKKNRAVRAIQRAAA